MNEGAQHLPKLLAGQLAGQPTLSAALEAAAVTFLRVLAGGQEGPPAAESLDPAGMVIPMPDPTSTVERTRVRVAKPKPGRRQVWCLRVRGPERDSVEQTELAYTKTNKTKAERLARQRESELNGEGGTTVAEALTAYAAWCEERKSAGTAASVKQALLRCERSEIWSMPGDLVTRADLQRASDSLADLKLGTARTYKRIWWRAWAWGVARGMGEKEWPKLAAQRATAADKTKKRALTPSEVDSLLGAARRYAQGRYLTLILALSQTGARVGEFLSADVGDFVVPPALGGAGVIRLRHTKTGVPRDAFVSPELAQAIRSEVAGRTSGPLWTNYRGKRMKHSSVHMLMVEWRKAEGLRGQVDLHSLRRYAVAKLEQAGAPRAAGRALTGQTSETYDSYADKGQHDVLAAARLLWVPRAFPLSPAVATLSKQGQSTLGVTVAGESFPQIAQPHGGQAIADRRVPACPRLMGTLRTARGRLPQSLAALRQALRIMPDAEE